MKKGMLALARMFVLINLIAFLGTRIAGTPFVFRPGLNLAAPLFAAALARMAEQRARQNTSRKAA